MMNGHYQWHEADEALMVVRDALVDGRSAALREALQVTLPTLIRRVDDLVLIVRAEYELAGGDSGSERAVKTVGPHIYDGKVCHPNLNEDGSWKG